MPIAPSFLTLFLSPSIPIIYRLGRSSRLHSVLAGRPSRLHPVLAGRSKRAFI